MMEYSVYGGHGENLAAPMHGVNAPISFLPVTFPSEDYAGDIR